MYAGMKLVATWSKKLTIPLVVFTSVDLFERIPVRWMLPRKFRFIIFYTDFGTRDLLANNPTAEIMWKTKVKLHTSGSVA